MTLESIFERHGADKAKANGWHGYSSVYQELFEPLRHAPVKLLEIGVCFGASIKAWLEYFDHPQAAICGVDVINNFPCNDPRYTYAQGDQADPEFWKKFNPFLSEWSIVVDDGPHTLPHQQISFEHLWPNVASGGLWCCEDTWTWPDPLWKQQSQASSFLTQLVWWLNKSGKQYHGRPGGKSEPLNEMESSIDFIHMYPGLMILKKK